MQNLGRQREALWVLVFGRYVGISLGMEQQQTDTKTGQATIAVCGIAVSSENITLECI